MARVDVSRLAALIEEQLAPLYDAPERPVWAEIEERKAWIGRPDRPQNVGFRRMRPRGYLQFGVANDEDPPSPWAMALPADLARRDEIEAEVRAVSAVCERLYGPGRMHLCVLAVLAPGGQVPVHRDMPHAIHRKAYSHHLHIPIISSPRVHYTFGDEDFAMEAGAVYEINNMIPHSVVNRSEVYRVNVMIDYCPAASVPLLDAGEAAYRAALARGGGDVQPSPRREPPSTEARLEILAEDGLPLHLDLDSIALKNIVLVPGARAAQAYLAHLFPYFDGALLVAADGSHPTAPALRDRALQALADDPRLAVFVFGWDSLARLRVASDRLFVADDLLVGPLFRAEPRRGGSIAFDERSLATFMASFFAQFEKRQILGDHSYYYRHHSDLDQARFDWRMDLLLADPPAEPE